MLNNANMDYYQSLDSRSLHSTPTIFELFSAAELNDLLSPSLRYLIVYYSSRFPRYLTKLALKFDELNLVLKLWLEWYHLNHFNSSFTEKFYGLKRISRLNIRNIADTSAPGLLDKYTRLSRLQVLVGCVELCGVPYITSKLDYLYEQRIKAHLLSKQAQKERPLEHRLLQCYKYGKVCVRLVNLWLQILYLSGNSRSLNVLHYLFGIEYARVSAVPDLGARATQPQRPANRPPSFNQHVLAVLGSRVAPLASRLGKSVAVVFPVLIFSLKFIEWWNLNNDKFRKSLAAFRYRPPANSRVLGSQENCLLCGKAIVNHTVLEDGHVFCYTCVHDYVVEHGHSPVDRKPLVNVKPVGTGSGSARFEILDNCLRRLIV